MIVDLPAPALASESTMAGSMGDIACQDLFVSVLDMDDEHDIDFGLPIAPGQGPSLLGKERDGALRRESDNGQFSFKGDIDLNDSPGSGGGGDFLRAPIDHFVYSSTSASESEGDILMSDIGTDAEHPPVQMQDFQDAYPDSPSVLTEILPFTESLLTKKLNELNFNSPRALPGTPYDTTRRYEYPYPSPSQDDLPPVLGLGMDFVPTPALSPEVEPPDPFSRYTSSMTTAPPNSAPVPAPRPTPVTLLAAMTPVLTLESWIPLPAAAVVAQPKRGRFKSANVPIPPKLRRRIARMSGLFPSSVSSSKLDVQSAVDVDTSATFPVETPTTPRAAWL